MNERSIVIVEDEAMIASSLRARLEREGFKAFVATDGSSGVQLCREVRPDLVILDLMLPGLDGIEVCRRIQKDRTVPVLMLTARDSETDILVGLGVGADDYMTKPFSPRELVARVHALLRRADRTGREPSGSIHIGDLEIAVDARRVRRDAQEAHLTPTEFDLLSYLAAHPERVFTRSELLNDVWGYADALGTRTVDSHVRSLRRKLGNDLVRTVHGVGYGLGVGSS